MLITYSIRVQLTLWYVLLLAVILAVLSVGMYLALRHILYSNLDESLESNATAFLDVIQYDGNRPTLAIRFPSDSPGEGEQFVRIFDISGGLTFDNSSEMGDVPVDALVIEAALVGKSTVRGIKVADDPIRVIALPIQRDGGG